MLQLLRHVIMVKKVKNNEFYRIINVFAYEINDEKNTILHSNRNPAIG